MLVGIRDIHPFHTFDGALGKDSARGGVHGRIGTEKHLVWTEEVVSNLEEQRFMALGSSVAVELLKVVNVGAGDLGRLFAARVLLKVVPAALHSLGKERD